MQVFDGLQRFSPPANGAVVTIGNFDGVHRGHARIIRRAQEIAARSKAATIVMTFHPHPLEVLAPERAPAQLTMVHEKLQLIERCGVDACVVLRPDPSFLAQEAEDFLATLVAHARPRAIVEGPDFNFGRGRRGSIETLRTHAERWGYDVEVVPAVRCEELRTHPIISSSSVRQALRDGRVDDADVMLGRPYRVVGVTGSGYGRGEGLGFPTANLDDIPHMLPQEAVYAAVAQLGDGSLHMAAVNVGPQPTFEQTASRVEAHVLDFHEDMRGRRLGLHFITRLREQQRFAGAVQLVAQLERDVATTRDLGAAVARVRSLEPLPL